MSEEKKSEVTEEVKEARKLSMEELEQVTGGASVYVKAKEAVGGDVEDLY